jgi:hypothetical protein
MLIVCVLGLAACASGGSSQSGAPPGAGAAPTPTPVPTSAVAPVGSEEDAAARVIATDPRFAGATALDPNAIGLTKWWEARELGGGAYEIKLTLGWGDCPAGCIEHHTWVFNVAADGTVTPMSDSGDSVPTNL